MMRFMFFTVLLLGSLSSYASSCVFHTNEYGTLTAGKSVLDDGECRSLFNLLKDSSKNDFINNLDFKNTRNESFISDVRNIVNSFNTYGKKNPEAVADKMIRLLKSLAESYDDCKVNESDPSLGKVESLYDVFEQVELCSSTKKYIIPQYRIEKNDDFNRNFKVVSTFEIKNASGKLIQKGKTAINQTSQGIDNKEIAKWRFPVQKSVIKLLEGNTYKNKINFKTYLMDSMYLFQDIPRYEESITINSSINKPGERKLKKFTVKDLSTFINIECFLFDCNAKGTINHYQEDSKKFNEVLLTIYSDSEDTIVKDMNYALYFYYNGVDTSENIVSDADYDLKDLLSAWFKLDGVIKKNNNSSSKKSSSKKPRINPSTTVVEDRPETPIQDASADYSNEITLDANTKKEVSQWKIFLPFNGSVRVGFADIKLSDALEAARCSKEEIINPTSTSTQFKVNCPFSNDNARFYLSVKDKVVHLYQYTSSPELTCDLTVKASLGEADQEELCLQNVEDVENFAINDSNGTRLFPAENVASN